VFLGSGDILVFEPTSASEQDKKEAEDKTAYINWLVRGQPNSFKIIIDWIKEAEIQKCSVVTFYYDEQKAVEEIKYKGLSEDEIAQLKSDIEDDKKVTSVKIDSKESEDGRYNITFKVTRTKGKHVIENVPIENFILSKNAKSKEDADIVGHMTYPRRGELISQGYDKKTVNLLPASGQSPDDRMAELRYSNANGDFSELTARDMNARVEVAILYPLLDYDEDGTLQRRFVKKCGTEILEDEPYGIAPYAIMSTITMPHSAIGRSRAEIVKPTQYIKSYVYRGMMNNAYAVNNPRWGVDADNVNMDDFLTERVDGIVRTTGNPANSLLPIVTPYIGDKALQVIQYIDHARAQSTGSLMASQGLQADQLHKETATRFEGVQDASIAKVELVARVIAETGFRELYEGLAWQVKHFQNDEAEIFVLGKPIKINPSDWRYEHCAASAVGLGAGDQEMIMQNMSGLIMLLQQYQQQGLPLVDSKKLYNATAKVIKAMGFKNVGDFINDPEQPAEVLMAQNEQMAQMLGMAQGQIQQLQNEVATNQMKAQAQIAIENNRAQIKMQQTEMETDIDWRKFLVDQAAKQQQFQQQMLLKLTELDMKINTPQQDDIPGTLENTQ
jgi:hypothetical protein